MVYARIDKLDATLQSLHTRSDLDPGHIYDGLRKNANYGQAVDVRIQHIKKARQLFQDAANTFLHWRLSMIDGTVVETNELVEESHHGIQKLQGDVGDAKKGVHETKQDIMRRLSGLESNVMNRLQDVLSDLTKNAKCKLISTKGLRQGWC